MNKQKLALLGAHISIARGFDQAIIQGMDIGCTAIQIFTKSNRRWDSHAIEPHKAALFKETLNRSSIRMVIAHASYLLNLASSDPELEKKSVVALIIEMQRCEYLGIQYLVVHPGSHKTTNSFYPPELLKKIAKNIDVAFSATRNVTILLETMAGQGTSVGNTFEQLAEIYNYCATQQRLGFCVDTCHIFAAGYDIRTEQSYTDVWKHFDAILKFENLKMIHLNDSVKEFASKVDRHAHIGKGKIGLKFFELIMNDPKFVAIPKIVETPKKAILDDKENVEVLRQLIK